MNILIDRTLADVRLDAGMHNVERIVVREILDEVEIGSRLIAETRGLQFEVTKCDLTVAVHADRQILAAAIANLLQNAFKFTKPHSTVKLEVTSTTERVLIKIEDACGGLPPEQSATLLKPFTQQGRDRTGLGLGLSICMKAVKSMAGELRIQDLPGTGCIFTIDLPKQPLLPLRL